MCLQAFVVVDRDVAKNLFVAAEEFQHGNPGTDNIQFPCRQQAAHSIMITRPRGNPTWTLMQNVGSAIDSATGCDGTDSITINTTTITAPLPS